MLQACITSLFAHVQVNLQLKEAELAEADAQLNNIADALEASIKKPSYRTTDRSIASASPPSASPEEHREKSKAHDDIGVQLTVRLKPCLLDGSVRKAESCCLEKSIKDCCVL